jgi:hypothetical protein
MGPGTLFIDFIDAFAQKHIRLQVIQAANGRPEQSIGGHTRASRVSESSRD